MSTKTLVQSILHALPVFDEKGEICHLVRKAKPFELLCIPYSLYLLDINIIPVILIVDQI